MESYYFNWGITFGMLFLSRGRMPQNLGIYFRNAIIIGISSSTPVVNRTIGGRLALIRSNVTNIYRWVPKIISE